MKTKSKIRKARLDPNGNEKPLTEIRAVHIAGECVFPGFNAESYLIVEKEK